MTTFHDYFSRVRSNHIREKYSVILEILYFIVLQYPLNPDS